MDELGGALERGEIELEDDALRVRITTFAESLGPSRRTLSRWSRPRRVRGVLTPPRRCTDNIEATSWRIEIPEAAMSKARMNAISKLFELVQTRSLAHSATQKQHFEPSETTATTLSDTTQKRMRPEVSSPSNGSGVEGVRTPSMSTSATSSKSKP